MSAEHIEVKHAEVDAELILIPGLLSLINGDLPFDSSGYLVKTSQGPVIVDVGSGRRNKQVKTILENSTAQSHRTILLATHKHMDHIGGAGKLVDAGYAAEVWVGQQNITVEPTGDIYAADLYDTRFPGMRVDRVLHHGEVLRFGDVRFLVVETPGHAPDHVCYIMLYHGIAIAFLGDINGGHSHRLGGDLGLQVNSITRLLDYKFDYVLEGHGSLMEPLRTRREFEQSVHKFGERLGKGFGYLEDPMYRTR